MVKVVGIGVCVVVDKTTLRPTPLLRLVPVNVELLPLLQILLLGVMNASSVPVGLLLILLLLLLLDAAIVLQECGVLLDRLAVLEEPRDWLIARPRRHHVALGLRWSIHGEEAADLPVLLLVEGRD